MSIIKNVFAGIGVVMVCVGMYGYASSQNRQAAQDDVLEALEEAESLLTTETVETTATEFYEAYKSNSAAANEKYQGKLVYLTGKVRAVKSLFDRQIIVFESPSRVDPTIALLAESAVPKAAVLNKGDTVTVNCHKINQSVGTPKLNGCGL